MFFDEFDINSFDKHGNNIMHYFIKNRSSINVDIDEFFKKVLEKGIDLNAVQAKSPRRSALHLCVFMKDEAFFKLLLKNGVNIEVVDDNGNTPLWLAVMSYKDDTSFFIKCLLKQGADINKMNNHGVSPVKLSDTISNYNSKQFFI